MHSVRNVEKMCVRGLKNTGLRMATLFIHLYPHQSTGRNWAHIVKICERVSR